MTSLKKALRERRTAKVLGDPEAPLAVSGEHRATIDAMLAEAARAPFHHASHAGHHAEMASAVPWRFYKFDAAQCRKLLAELKGTHPTAGKILNMLAAADALVQVTWLPDLHATEPPPRDGNFAGSLRNMEHIAASAAAVQSFLLLATSHGYRTYWSSGGVLRSDAVLERMAMPRNQILLGSVFLYPQDVGSAEILPGKLRDKRGEISDWSVWRAL